MLNKHHAELAYNRAVRRNSILSQMKREDFAKLYLSIKQPVRTVRK